MYLFSRKKYKPLLNTFKLANFTTILLIVNNYQILPVYFLLSEVEHLFLGLHFVLLNVCEMLGP